MRPPNWLVVALAAVGVHIGRERLLDGGLLLAELEAIPDPALDLLSRLNLTERLQAVKEVLGERRNQSIKPGHALKHKLRARHPAVFIPGIISCGLEVWRPGDCLGENWFRERIWGGVSMAQAVVGNITCWLEHLSLDPLTGTDPPNVAVRAAEGFSGADYFVPGYWLWAKLIESVAAIGHSPLDLHVACFDWRLPYSALEARDHYHSRLRALIEAAVKRSGYKAVIVAHSMGANVWLHFMQWVSMVAGPGWVANYVHAFVSLSGAILGAVGPLGALLSGEMQSTAILGPLNKLLNSQVSLLNYNQIRDFLRTIGSLGSLLPKGGTAVWGSSTSPTDEPVDLVSRGDEVLDIEGLLKYLGKEMGNHTAISDYIHDVKVPAPWPDAGSAVDAATAAQEAESNPLATALPPAPELRIFCLYGVGIQTERAYKYAAPAEDDPPPLRNRFGTIDYWHSSAPNSTDHNASPNHVPVFSSGVATTDGDGTVPLVSMGYMCREGWREERLRAFNPSGAKTYVHEYVDRPVHVWEDPRGGPATSKHVEILGNREAIQDILHIIAGEDMHLRKDRIYSEISSVSSRVTRNLVEKLGPSAAG